MQTRDWESKFRLNLTQRVTGSLVIIKIPISNLVRKEEIIQEVIIIPITK